MKRFFIVFLVLATLFSLVGCNGVKDNGKTVVGTFGNYDCYVTTDILSLGVGAYNSFFVRSDEKTENRPAHHINQETYPCRVFVIEEKHTMRECFSVVEQQDGTFFVGYETSSGRFGAVLTKEEMEDFTVKKYYVEVFLPDNNGKLYQKIFIYDSETQTWK